MYKVYINHYIQKVILTNQKTIGKSKNITIIITTDDLKLAQDTAITESLKYSYELKQSFK